MKTKHCRYLLICIILLAIFLRFYNFPIRWQVSPDQARDAIIASEFLKHKSLPLVGSLSSAGPFAFGQLFYWFVIGCYFLAPKILIFPWLALTLIDILLVLVFFKIGQALKNKKMGLLLSFLSAISTNQLLRASNLTQHTFVSIAAALTILFFILTLKKKKPIYLFLLGASIGLGINMHYQGLNLLLYSLAVFIHKKISFKKLLSSFSIFFSGLLTPNLPLLYWDFFYQKWANIKNLIEYFLIGQYKIWVSNRWLTYVGEFWPNFWAKTIGGEFIIGVIFMTLLAIVGSFLFFKKQLKKEIFWLAIIFSIQVFLNRYYRGERLEGYLLYFHPLVLVFSGWLILQIININKWIGVAFLLTVSFFTLKKDIKTIKLQDNQTSKIWQIISRLEHKYPDQKFAIYDFYGFDSSLSHILSLFFYFRNLSGYNNVYIGVGQGVPSYEDQNPIFQIEFRKKEFQLYELDKETVKKKEWFNVNFNSFYPEGEQWWKMKGFLKSTFSFKEYLITKLNLS